MAECNHEKMKFKITKEDGSEEVVEGVRCEEVNILTIGATGDVYEAKGDHLIPFWNQFPSQEAAEMEILRRKAMAYRWRPKGGTYYYWCFASNRVSLTAWAGTRDDILNFLIGNCFQTNTPRKAIEEGAKAFNYLINQK